MARGSSGNREGGCIQPTRGWPAVLWAPDISIASLWDWRCTVVRKWDAQFLLNKWISWSRAFHLQSVFEYIDKICIVSCVKDAWGVKDGAQSGASSTLSSLLITDVPLTPQASWWPPPTPGPACWSPGHHRKTTPLSLSQALILGEKLWLAWG